MSVNPRRHRAGTPAVLLLLALLGPGTAIGEPLSGRLAPLDGLVVVDAGGQVVGPLAGTVSGILAVVRLRLAGRDILLLVGTGRIGGFLRAGYESPDCTGPAYLDFNLPPELATLFLELAALGPLNEVLVMENDEVTRTITSEWNGFSEPPACDLVAGPSPGTVRPTTSLGPVGTFTPPFRLRRSE
jgi:hypothetical protein